jgi:hypothetical protein
MRSFFKKISFTVLIIFCTAFFAYADTPLEDLQNGVADLSGSLAKSLPFNAAIGLNWSDAYIGKFFPSVPPHFGVGVSFGFTTMDIPSLNGVAEILGFTIPDMLSDKMTLPAYAAEARIGGFFLPFDIGLKYGILPPVEMFNLPFKLNYSLFGADVRWALMEGNLILPKLSVGLGINYLDGGISAKVGSGTTFSFGDSTLKVDEPEINLVWDTFVVEAKAQISKSFLIITPYAGIGVGYSWSKAGYKLITRMSYNDEEIGDEAIEEIQDYLGEKGLNGIDFTDNGFSSIIESSGMSFRVYGGLSFNLTVVKLDLTLMYNFLDSQFGATFGLRVQL